MTLLLPGVFAIVGGIAFLPHAVSPIFFFPAPAQESNNNDKGLPAKPKAPCY
jgi:hypothetical protein